MNEKEMMKQLQDLRASMKEEDANAFLVQVAKMAEVFYTSAIALTKLCNMFQGKDPQEPEKCEEEDDDWDEDDDGVECEELTAVDFLTAMFFWISTL